MINEEKNENEGGVVVVGTIPTKIIIIPACLTTYFANGGCIKHIIERRGHLEPVLMLLELVPP